MTHGATILNGPQNWQILQQSNGKARLSLSGTWCVHPEALTVGIASASPVVRVLREEDNYPVIPWTKSESIVQAPCECGKWSMELELPAGGLYTIEAGLDVVSVKQGLAWMFRGDIILHVGVGDVFVIAGQSNAAGFGRDSAFDPPDLRVHMFRNCDAWDIATHPMNESTGVTDHTNVDRGVGGTSPYLAFGKQFSQASHCPVGLIATALGGQPISRWDISVNGDLFVQMLHKIRMAGGQAAGILWYQGCSDTNEQSAPLYLQRFERMVKELRHELGYEIPIFTCQLNRELTPGSDIGYGIVRNAQRLATKLSNVYVMPTLDGDLSDGIHNSSHANLRLGERLARQCLGVLYGTTPLNAPEIISAIIKDQSLELTFKNVVGNITLRTSNVEQCGVTVTDIDGDIDVLSIKTEPTNRQMIFATLSRPPHKGATVSYLWQSNPSHVTALDNATFLPPLSFYQFPITYQ